MNRDITPFNADVTNRLSARFLKVGIPRDNLRIRTRNQRLIYNDTTQFDRVIADNGRAKEFDAIVDAVGAGDFTTISAAVSAGSANIYVRNGSYTETTQIIFTSSTIITGEDPLNTVVTFAGLTVPAFFVDANSGVVESAGTIAVTNGSAIVTGAGTTFTNLLPGNSILIGQLFYIIVSITNDTSLIIAETYNGASFTGESYIATQLMNSIVLQNFSVQNSATTPSVSNAVSIRGVQGLFLRNFIAVGFVGNVIIDTSSSIILENFFTRSAIGKGLVLSDVFSTQILAAAAANCTSDGFEITGTEGPKGIIFDQCVSTNNGGVGVRIGDAASIVNFTNSQIEFNVSDGIRSTVGTSRILVDQCNVGNNANGINFSGSSNIVSGCIVAENTGHGLKIGDEGAIVSNTINNNGSFGIDLQNDQQNTISANSIHDNGDSGISFSGGTSQDNVITGNNIFDNTNNGIDISGSGSGDNTISGNVVKDNTGTSVGINVSSDKNCISGNRVSGHGIGILLAASSDDNVVVANQTFTNTTGISDLGTANLVANNK